MTRTKYTLQQVRVRPVASINLLLVCAGKVEVMDGKADVRVGKSRKERFVFGWKPLVVHKHHGIYKWPLVL